MFYFLPITHTIHVWYIYLHLVAFYGLGVGKYTSPMDAPLSHSPLGEGFAMPTIEAFAKYSSVALFRVEKEEQFVS